VFSSRSAFAQVHFQDRRVDEHDAVDLALAVGQPVGQPAAEKTRDEIETDQAFLQDFFVQRRKFFERVGDDPVFPGSGVVIPVIGAWSMSARYFSRNGSIGLTRDCTERMR